MFGELSEFVRIYGGLLHRKGKKECKRKPKKAGSSLVSEYNPSYTGIVYTYKDLRKFVQLGEYMRGECAFPPDMTNFDPEWNSAYFEEHRRYLLTWVRMFRDSLKSYDDITLGEYNELSGKYKRMLSRMMERAANGVRLWLPPDGPEPRD